MHTEQNTALVRNFFEDVLNRGNVDAIDEFVTADYTLHAVGFPGPMDRDHHKGFVAALRAAFPDWHETVEEVVAEGDQVVARVTERGTHRGEFMGVPATGRPVKVISVYVDRIVGGRIAERWLLPDTQGPLQQLGVLPSAALTEA